jgi:hypothetical protein
MDSRIQFLLLLGFLGSTIPIGAAATPNRSWERARQADQHTESPLLEKQPDFILLYMGHGVSDDGDGYSMNTFKSANGEKLFVIMLHYGSPDAVKKAFEHQLSKATKVLEQQTITGEKGEKEQRAVITFTARYKKEASRVLITAGSELREIESHSLQDVLNFEKQTKN